MDQAPKGETLKTVDAAKADLRRLIDEAAASHDPIQITGEGGSAVLVSEEDWRAVQETLYLLSVPGMRESIREGIRTPPSECSPEPGL
jgi:prevent-host-death family protein